MAAIRHSEHDLVVTSGNRFTAFRDGYKIVLTLRYLKANLKLPNQMTVMFYLCQSFSQFHS